MGQESNRRNHKRISLGLPITAEFRTRARGTDADALLLDISQGGMLLSSKQPAAIGNKVMARFSLHGEPLGTARGLVLRRQDNGSFAVAFGHCSDRLQTFVKDLVSLRPALRVNFLCDVLDAHVSIE